jgi:IS5 family transposase
MLGKSDKNLQLNLMETPLAHFIHPGHELCLLADKINWKEIEKDFAVYYSSKGAPSIPIRTMVGLIMLKQAYHYSDRSSIRQWIENPYWQHFCGETCFQHKAPFNSGDYWLFRKRIGEQGEKKIAVLGNKIFGSSFSMELFKSGKKSYSARKKGFLNRFLYRIGNLLIRITTR